MEDSMFYLKRMIQLLSGNKPQQYFAPVGSSLCGVSKVSAQLVRATKFQKLRPYKLVPENDCFLKVGI
jgi:hypothetical protein